MNKLPDETHPTDIGSLVGSSKSAKDEYFRYMLRKEKLKDVKSAGFLSSEERSALDKISEQEQIELRCYARLSALADHSPEYLQIKSIVGGEDREEIARKLSKLYMERVLVEDVLNRFISPSKSKDLLQRSNTASRSSYDLFASQ